MNVPVQILLITVFSLTAGAQPKTSDLKWWRRTIKASRGIGESPA